MISYSSVPCSLSLFLVGGSKPKFISSDKKQLGGFFSQGLPLLIGLRHHRSVHQSQLRRVCHRTNAGLKPPCTFIDLLLRQTCVVVLDLHPAMNSVDVDAFATQKMNHRVLFFLRTGCTWSRHFTLLLSHYVVFICWPLFNYKLHCCQLAGQSHYVWVLPQFEYFLLILPHVPLKMNWVYDYLHDTCNRFSATQNRDIILLSSTLICMMTNKNNKKAVQNIQKRAAKLTCAKFSLHLFSFARLPSLTGPTDLLCSLMHMLM